MSTITLKMRALILAGAVGVAGLAATAVPAVASAAGTIPTTTKATVKPLAATKTEAELCKERGGKWVPGKNGGGFCYEELKGPDNTMATMVAVD